MGCEFQIHVWRQYGDPAYYAYGLFWEGDDLADALEQLMQAHREYGCVRFVWRAKHDATHDFRQDD